MKKKIKSFKKYLALMFVSLLFMSCSSLSGRSLKSGIITKQSNIPADKTLARILKVLRDKKITVFKVINHHEGASSVHMAIEPTITIIFGNPKLGTPLTQDVRTVAIDLPQKILVYEDKQKTYVSYNDPLYLKGRHGLANLPQLKIISNALAQITNKAIE